MSARRKRFEVGQDVTVRWKRSGKDVPGVVTYVGRTIGRVKFGHWESAFHLINGQERAHFTPEWGVFTPEMLVEHERRGAALERVRVFRGYGWDAYLTSDELTQIADIVDAAYARGELQP
jgi:hypothetical protein